MLVQGDLSLDLVQMYSGSFKDALKQTMLSQEVMFRNQVLELHRLYDVQRILMQNFGVEEFDRHGFRKAGMKSTFMPYANPARYDPFMKETEVFSIRMLQKRPAQNCKLQLKHLNLQLPADQYISLIEPDLEELDLSLDLGVGNREKESDKEILMHEKSRCMLSQEVIDLEDSIDDDAENVYSLDLNVPTIECTGKESENSHGHISSDYLPIKNQQFGSYEAGYLDLNEAQNDDSSCHSNDLIMTRYSTSTSSSGFKGAFGKVQQANCTSPIRVKEKNNCSTESSTLDQDANETHTTESKFKGTNTCEMYNTQWDEAPMESIVNGSNNFRNCRDNESEKLEAIIEPPADRHTRVQKSEVCSDCNHAAEDGCNGVLTISGMSNCNAENDSGGEKKVQILSLSSNQSYETQKGLHSTETILSTEQDHKSSCSIESEHDEESSEMKLLLQNAAESLVSMSLADSGEAHDCNTKTESNGMGKVRVDQPQHSSDSFELLVLKQAENGEDEEFSVSSQLSEVVDLENMNVGFKLRRGRRLKDFQREILPSLSCLSRHEICEDINIMEAVLRSREYRKIRAKMQDGQKWSVPTKSKRSRRRTIL
ncbi:uncharacterized protein LOC111491562 isoform X1 [Cucurbita maxima]|uniref:Uncharacterized protein LOC111491562 isoform X1 n=1 Tax=Cucurbita maxima TaxID=3661 RepID=A0A6J1K4B3_CUCMA|nr:uncharacterized protein LOC111491562 isoform X1 [Cucurbita maxima]